MVIFVGPSSFIESLYSTFAGLAADPVAKVRKTLASSLHELAKLVGTSFNTTKVQIVRLFHGKNFLWIKNDSEAFRSTVFGVQWIFDLSMFDLSKIFDLCNNFAFPDTLSLSKNYCISRSYSTLLSFHICTSKYVQQTAVSCVSSANTQGCQSRIFVVSSWGCLTSTTSASLKRAQWI